jgi:hypothetical protein
MLRHLFPGESRDVALVIAGVHGTEKSGIEVVQWLRVKLKAYADAGRRPRYTTILVPVVYPESLSVKELGGIASREFYWVGPRTKKPYRIPPNRQFPPPGKPLSFLLGHGGPASESPPGRITRINRDANGRQISSQDGNGVPLLEGTRKLLQLIELVKPKRIASVHGHGKVATPARGVDAPGVFVDPRYDYDEHVCGKDPVDEQPDKWGTSLCKFDLTVDPASPVVGRIVKMNKALAQRSIPNTLVQQAQPALDEGCRIYAEALANFRSSRNPDDINKPKRQQAYDKFIEAANILQVDFKPADFAAQTSLGQSDDPLALAIAVKTPAACVPGNHLNERDSSGRVLPPVVHYTESAGHPDGFSLGDWGPVEVKASSGDPGSRPGAPVITVEVFENQASGAFFKGRQLVKEQDCKSPVDNLSPDDKKRAGKVDPKRCNDLKAYAEALLTEFL